MREAAVLEPQPAGAELQPFAGVAAAPELDQHVIDPAVRRDDQVRLDRAFGGLQDDERLDAPLLRKLDVHLPALAVAQIGLYHPFSGLKLNRADAQGLAFELRRGRAKRHDRDPRLDRREDGRQKKRQKGCPQRRFRSRVHVYLLLTCAQVM